MDIMDMDRDDPMPGSSPALADAGADGHGDGHGPWTMDRGLWRPADGRRRGRQSPARAGARHGARLKRSKSGEAQAVRARPARRASGDRRDRLISHFDFARRSRDNFAPTPVPEKPAAPGPLCALAAAVCQTASTTARLLCCHLIYPSSPPPSLILSPSPSPSPSPAANWSLFPLSATIDDVNPTTPVLALALLSTPRRASQQKLLVASTAPWTTLDPARSCCTRQS
jgi:hypothetical protein